MSILSGPVRDWSVASSLVSESWKNNRESPLEYTPEFLASLFEYPGDGPPIAPALYDDGRLIAFVAGFPRSVALRGHARRLLLMSFLTVAPDCRRRGHGRAVFAECVRQARIAGYDGTLHYCVEGNPSNTVTVAAVRDAGFESRRIFTVRYMMGMCRHRSEPAEPEQAMDSNLFLGAVESLARRVPLSRVWSLAEANWQIHQRPGRISCADPRGGVLTGYALKIADAARTPCVFVEDVLWDRLEPDARGALLRRFLERSAEAAKLAVLPVLEYADLSPFVAAGFRLSPRRLHAYLTLWNDTPPEEDEVSGFYLDVL